MPTSGCLFASALQGADKIKRRKYYTLALTEVAQGWYQLGDLAGAKDILARAERMMFEIDSPYAGSFPRARVASTYAKIGEFKTAVWVVEEINDNDLRARLFWSVS